MVVETQVRETDIYKVEKNQQVVISVDAYPELELRGEVDYIGLWPGGRGPEGGKYFTVTILVDEADQRLRRGCRRGWSFGGASASAVYVPLEAVFERGESTTVTS
jgi:hypothetical protein